MLYLAFKYFFKCVLYAQTTACRPQAIRLRADLWEVFL